MGMQCNLRLRMIILHAVDINATYDTHAGVRKPVDLVAVVCYFLRCDTVNLRKPIGSALSLLIGTEKESHCT